MKRPARSVATSPSTPASPWPIGVVFALIGLAALAAYWPALHGAPLWDDAGHLTAPALQSGSGLLRIWFEPGATQQYYPLLHSAFWLEHQLWGDSTLGYHLVNVLWHALAATLFVALLRRLEIRGATLAGFIFALHPVCVESVAWISEQKNTLSLVLALAAALAWLRYDDERRPCGRGAPIPRGEGDDAKRGEGTPPTISASSRRFYALATALFVAALLTKTVTATLPAALLVLVWWRRGRLSWRDDAVPLLPWFALGLVAGLGTAWLETAQIGATGRDFSLGPIERVLLAGRVVWFYVGKLLWPADLAFFYPRWTVDATVAWQWLFTPAALAVLAVAAWASRRHRAPLAAALLYGGMLFPVLGFVNVYPFIFSYVADHFQYHASLALFAFLSAAATLGWARLAWPRWTGPAAAAVLLSLLGFLTWRQSATYRDVVSLYEATLARNPDSWVAHLNLGTVLDDSGRPAQALPHLQRANALKPDHPETLNSLASVLNRLGRPAEARPLLERALQLQPRFAAAHNTLGVSLMALGQADAGIAAFHRALELNPRLTPARINLGWALANSGRPAEALAALDQARREQPENADAHFKTGLVHVRMHRPREAEPHLRRAVELQPEQLDYRLGLGVLLIDLGRPAAAAEEFEAALELAPGHPGALQGLQQAHLRLGR